MSIRDNPGNIQNNNSLPFDTLKTGKPARTVKEANCGTASGDCSFALGTLEANVACRIQEMVMSHVP